ncbi:GH25 family lysozyme [Luteimonas sp BLCC-B24]|uniref:GH25 family lysozyme n=1 Tax=Luteimonas sp. BLCC-B24 TaxID=3025317 RepID=UPI00234C9847|nr:GH25 family lysozyme [Luteimonas sp. BLCC-B24]MDC7807112.1 GH25 family lysozyme [Luteimonas sp. BLCC-B24]
MHSAIRFVRALASLPETDRAWLRAVLAACADGPIALSEAWQRAWFSPRPGTGLILQPDAGAAYLYVAVAQAGTRDRLGAETLSAAVLLADMARCGIATAHPVAHATPGAFRCIGDIFDTPRVAVEHGTPRIVLNAAGDYTEDPTEIRCAGGDVRYVGHPFGPEASALLLQFTSGVMAIRADARATALRDSLASERTRPTRVEAEGAPEPTDADAASPDLVDEALPHTTWDAAAWPGSAFSASASRPTRRRRAHRCPRWVAALVACKLCVAFGVGIGVYVDDVAEFLAVSQDISADAHPGPLPPSQSPTASAQPPAMPETWPTPLREDHDLDPHDATVDIPQPAPSALLGTDISQWSGHGARGASAVFDAVPDLHFAFVRVAYGRRLDHEFHSNWQLMAERGIYRGAYVFLRLDEDPIAQVDNAVDALGPATSRDLCLAIDFEELSFTPRGPPHDKQDVARIVLAALERARHRLGCMPLLYTNWSMGSTYLHDPQFAQYPLWIADWTDAPAPRLPPAWTTFAFWQRSDRLPASPSAADLDLFPGTPADLARLLRH